MNKFFLDTNIFIYFMQEVPEVISPVVRMDETNRDLETACRKAPLCGKRFI